MSEPRFDHFTQPIDAIEIVHHSDSGTLLTDEAIDAGRARVAAGESPAKVAADLAIDEVWMTQDEPLTPEEEKNLRVAGTWLDRFRGLIGTAKSGNYGHEGRPGEVGGSGAGGPAGFPKDDEPRHTDMDPNAPADVIGSPGFEEIQVSTFVKPEYRSQGVGTVLRKSVSGFVTPHQMDPRLLGGEFRSAIGTSKSGNWGHTGSDYERAKLTKKTKKLGSGVTPNPNIKTSIGQIAHDGSIESKENVPNATMHNDVFTRHAPASQRFRLNYGEIHWDDKPTADDYFAAESHYENMGVHIQGQSSLAGELNPRTLRAARSETAVHEAADTHYDQILVAMRYAFARGKLAVNRPALIAGITETLAQAGRERGDHDRNLDLKIANVSETPIETSDEIRTLIGTEKSGNWGHGGSGTFYHGTSRAALQSIMKNGLTRTQIAKWKETKSGFVYMTKTTEEAQFWARAQAFGERDHPIKGPEIRDVAILEIHVPASQFKKITGDENLEGDDAVKFHGDIKPEWIVNARIGSVKSYGHVEFQTQADINAEKALKGLERADTINFFVAIALQLPAGRWAAAAFDLQFTDRYQTIGIPYPDPATVCTGQCEGTGWIPVYFSDGDTRIGRSDHARSSSESDPALIKAWYAAEDENHTDDGWHFVKCPTCGGSGVRNEVIDETDELLAASAALTEVDIRALIGTAKSKLRAASTQHILAACADVPAAIKQALEVVLPGILHKCVIAGGQAGAVMLGKQLRAAIGNERSGNWGHGGDHEGAWFVSDSAPLSVAIDALPVHTALESRWQGFEPHNTPLHTEGDSTISPAWTDAKSEVEPAYWDAGQHATPVTMNIDDLSTYQTFVSGTKLHALERSGVDYSQPTGVVFDHGGHHWLVDGNHRTALAKLSGMKQVKLWHIDAETRAASAARVSETAASAARVSETADFDDFEPSTLPTDIKEWLDGLTMKSAGGVGSGVRGHTTDGLPHNGEISEAGLNKRFPIASEVVNGLTIPDFHDQYGPDVPNMSSISASLTDYEILEGVREVKMSDFEGNGKPSFYSSTESDRVHALADEMKSSQTITPLIVVVDDNQSPYVLEGGHRFDALKLNGIKKFPALVVVDTENLNIKKMKVAGSAKSGNWGHGSEREDPFAGMFKDRFPVKDPDGQPYAIYKGEMPGIGHQYDIVNGPLHGSTVSEATVNKLGLEKKSAIEDKFKGLELRTAKPQMKIAPLGMRFDMNDPRAIAWAQKHGAELAVGLSETTRQDIADAVSRGLDNELSHKELQDSIMDSVGNEKRAVTIARTESMTAANTGQRQAWSQAQDVGILSGKERREWLAVGDETMCDDCADLDGETAALDGQYPDPGGDGPVLHPNCRCSEGIAAGS